MGQDVNKVYLVGGGLASLAAAVYLIDDAHVAGEKIVILEQDDILGGALDGKEIGDHEFIIRGGRMHEEHYECYWELLSRIPSYDNPYQTVRDESFEFSEKYKSNALCRLLKNNSKVDLSTFGLSFKDRLDLLYLTYIPERLLDNKKIEDWFSPSFFTTNYWFLWSSMFAFQTWSSLTEMRRYMRRFIHLVEGLPYLGGVMRTKYNQYHSVVIPIKRYLDKKGVEFSMQTQVLDVDFNIQGKGSKKNLKATSLVCKNKSGNLITIKLQKNDFVFVTNGSITESTDCGSWKAAPILKGKASSGSWTLWEKLSLKDASFGTPGVFSNQIDLQKWYSFTAILKTSQFHDYMEKFSGNIHGTGGLVTIVDSKWLMSLVIARQPHFPHQPEGTFIFWGYGLYPDREGNFVKKKMSECTGEEILEELWSHLRVKELMQSATLENKVNCIPVAMPFIDSLFMPRAKGDRPLVIPKGSENFAFLGQFAEVPIDCVFTVEYSVRTAAEAVYGFFKTDKSVPPVYNSIHQWSSLLRALRALNR